MRESHALFCLRGVEIRRFARKTALAPAMLRIVCHETYEVTYEVSLPPCLYAH